MAGAEFELPVVLVLHHFYSSAFSSLGSSSGSGAGHPLLWQEPNLSFQSCLYFMHQSNWHSVSVLPQTMILYLPYSSGVHQGGYVLPSASTMPPAKSPLVTMPRLWLFNLACACVARSARSRESARIIGR